jgi:hypothetical protein
MTPENAVTARNGQAVLTPENAAVLADYANHLEHSPLSGHTPRTYLGAVRAYLGWLQDAGSDGEPLSNTTAKDWAVRDYRSYLVTVAKRATPTVNKHLAALVDFYTWRGLGQPQGVKRHQVPRHAPKALGPPAKLRYCAPLGPVRPHGTGRSPCCRCTQGRASPRSRPWTWPTSGCPRARAASTSSAKARKRVMCPCTPSCARR